MKFSIFKKQVMRFFTKSRLFIATTCALSISFSSVSQDLGGTAPVGAQVQPVSITFTKSQSGTVAVRKWYQGSGTNPFPGGYNYNFNATSIPDAGQISMLTNGFQNEFLISGFTYSQLSQGQRKILVQAPGMAAPVEVPNANYSNVGLPVDGSNNPLGTAWMTLPVEVLENQPWGKERDNVDATSGNYEAECDWTSIGMGQGAWFNLELEANAYYDFSWENFRTSKAEIEVVAGGAGSDGDFTLLEGTDELGWFSGTTAPTIRVWAVRNDADGSNWGENFPIISYRTQSPVLLSDNNPTEDFLCPNGTLSIANNGATNIPATLYWQGTNATGTSTSSQGSPNNVTSAGTYYYRAFDAVGGCWSDPKASTVTAKDIAIDATTSVSTVTCWESAQLGGSASEITPIHSANFNSGWDGWTPSNFVRATGFINGGENITSGGTNFVYWCSDCSAGGTSTLTSGAMSTVGISNIKFKLRMYFRQANPSSNSRIYVEYSTDGTNWTTQDITESTTNNYRIGTYNNFATKTYNIPAAFANQPTVYFRLRYTHTTDWSWSFDDIEIYGEATATSYSWSPTAGLSNPNIANPVATPANTTTYTLTAMVSGCAVTDQVTVNVDHSINAGSDITIACGDPHEIGFGTSNPVPGNPSSYTWSPAGSLDNASIANPLASPTATTTYTVDVEYPSGCIATDDVKVTTQTPTLNTSGNETILCGEEVVLHGITNVENLPFSWEVISGDMNSIVSGENALDVTVAPGDLSGSSTVYKFSIGLPTGCFMIGSQGQVTVTVNPLEVTAGALESELNCGQTTVLVGESNVPEEAEWSISSGDMNSMLMSNTLLPSIAPLNTTTYKIEAARQGCVTATDEITIDVEGVPANVVVPNPSTITCSEELQLGQDPFEINVLYYTDFETGNSGWDFGGNWTRTNTIGDVTAIDNYAAIIGSGNTQYLTLVNLPEGRDRVLGFYVLNKGNVLTSPTATVQYYNGSSWEVMGTVNANNSSWSAKTMAIPDNATQIRFRSNFSILTSHALGIDNITIAGFPIYSYEWSPATNLTATDIPNPIADPKETTTYTLEVTSPNCPTLQDEVEIVVDPFFNVEVLNSDVSICNNEIPIDLHGVVGNPPEETRVLFKDDFQYGLSTTKWSTTTWQHYTDGANSFIGITNNQSGTIQTVNLEVGTDRTLSFRHENPMGWLVVDLGIFLHVEYFDGANWLGITGGNNLASDDWANVTLDIPDNATEIRFRAQFTNTFLGVQYYAAIDDVIIEGQPVTTWSWSPSNDYAPGFYEGPDFDETLEPSVNPPGTTNYILTGYSLGCTYKDSVKIMVCLSWTGEIDDNWHEGGNWDYGVSPQDCDDDVFIPVTNTNYPLIVDDVYCGDVYVVNGAEVNFATGGVMNICGDVVGNGSIGSGFGFVKINGDQGPQEVSSFSTINVETLVMDNPDGMTNKGTTIVSHSIDLVDGTLTNDGGSVILDSDGETYTAYLDDFSDGYNGTFAGDLTAHVTLYSSMASAVKNKKKGYRQMASPVVSTVGASLSHLAFGPSGLYAGNATLTQQNFPTIWIYRETHQMDFNYNWYSYTNESNLLNPMVGVNVRVKEPTLDNLQVDFVGTPHTGSYSVPLTNSNGDPQGKGWNFIGNPYPSPIDWSSVDKGTSDGNAYLFHTEGEYAGTYATVNAQGVGTNNATGMFAMGQGFLVYTTQASGSISMTHENRVADNSALFYGKPNLQPNELRLKLTNGEISDEVVNYTNGGASADIDEGLDARKVPFDGDLYLAYALNDDNFSINVMDALEETTVLPLVMMVNKTGIYELLVEQQNIVGLTPYLKNKKTGDLTRLDTEIPVMLSLEGEEVYDNYEVVFKNGSSSTIEDAISNTIQIYANDNEVHIKRSNDGKANITITNLLGQTVVSTETTEQDLTFTLDASQANWVAVVKVQEKDQVKTVKVLIHK